MKFQNIGFVYIDALSRAHFKRKLPLTAAVITKYMSINPRNEDGAVYQFMKFHNLNLNDITEANIVSMFYGESVYNNPESPPQSILKYLKAAGYITGQTSNICSRELFDFEVSDEYVKSIKWEGYDHENIAMFCDPTYGDPNYYFQLFRGLYSMICHCLYGKDTFEYGGVYFNKFWTAYSNERKFFRIDFIDAHENSIEVIKFLDPALAIFLETFIDNNMQ